MGRVDLMNKSELNQNTSNFHSDLTRIMKRRLNSKRDDSVSPITCNFMDRQAFQILKLFNRGLSK